MTQDYNAAFTGLNAAMIDYYGHQNFKAFTDCGLDLGWSHPNASNFPNWPADDCYHTCNTNCTPNLSASNGTATPNGTTGATQKASQALQAGQTGWATVAMALGLLGSAMMII